MEPVSGPESPVQHGQDAGARDGGRPAAHDRRAAAVHGGGGAYPASIDISFGTGAGGNPGDDSFNPDATLAAGEELAALGVTWSGAGVPGDSLAHALESLERFGKAVIR